METINFKTDIKCTGCLTKVAPYLNETAGEGNWAIDLNNPAKTLSVLGEISEEEIVEAVQKAGYKANRINQSERLYGR